MSLGIGPADSINFVYLCIATLHHSTKENQVAGLGHISGEVIGIIKKCHKVAKHVVFSFRIFPPS